MFQPHFDRHCLQTWSLNQYCHCTTCSSFKRMGWTPEKLVKNYSAIMLWNERWVGKCKAYPESRNVPFRPKLKFRKGLLNAVEAKKWLKTHAETSLFYKQQTTHLSFYLEDKSEEQWDLLCPQVQQRIKEPNMYCLCLPINLY